MAMTRISHPDSHNKISPKSIAMVAVGILLAPLLYLSNGAQAKKSNEAIELGKKTMMYATSEGTMKSDKIFPY
jgi:glycerol uptake facilitator-like aquaporin